MSDPDVVSILTGPSPCDTCLHDLKCKARLLACRRYFRYVEYSTSNTESRRPKEAPIKWDGNLPSRRWFARIYKTHDSPADIDDIAEFQKRAKPYLIRARSRRTQKAYQGVLVPRRRWANANRTEARRWWNSVPAWARLF